MISSRLFKCLNRIVSSRTSAKHLHQNISKLPSNVTVEKLKISLKSEPEPNGISNYTIDTGLPLALGETKRKTTRGDRTTKNSLPPSLQYVRDTMDKYQDYVVLTQMGSFYELYFEHAEIYAPKLNLTLTSREYVHGKVSFAGFPVPQISRHLKVLVKDYGYSVAIADQFKKDNIISNDTSRFLRRVTRIVTPGTFIDEAFENLQENTFLLSLEFPENCMRKVADIDTKVGLCWCDISTGEIFVQQVLLKDVVSAITRIAPREILLDEEILAFKIESGEWYPEFVELKKFFIKYQKIPSSHRAIRSFHRLFSPADMEGKLSPFDIALHNFSQKETAALRNTLLYLEEHLPDMEVNLQVPKRQITSSIMQIDSRTCSALELSSTMRTNTRKGSLLSAIRRTVTPSGSRLLSQWLSAPSMDIKEIKQRQELVTLFRNNPTLTESLVRTLKKTYDMPRILQKFSFGKGDATELLQISHSLQAARVIEDSIEAAMVAEQIGRNGLLKSLMNPLAYNEDMVKSVLDSLDEEQLAEFARIKAEESIENDSPNLRSKSEDILGEANRWVVKREANKEFSALHDIHTSLLKDREELQQQLATFLVGGLQARTVQLKLKQSNEYAIHISATSSNISQIINAVKNGLMFRDEPFHLLQKSSQSCWLCHKSWTRLGQDIELAVMRIRREETALVNSLKQKFIQNSPSVRSVAQTLDYLDILTSFAELSVEKNLVCPVVDTSVSLDIRGGRHIVVEDGLMSKSLDKFTSNDCSLQGGTLWVVSGPNMGGKSTFLRQNAIIVIMAQVGSFVPCASARIGLVDKIFSRIGSADDLYNEMSTFMVEMIETSYILKGATERSLAILDEIGRGTSGKEGISIAYATLKHLVSRNRCRSLFATHFAKELEQLLNLQSNSTFQRNVSYYKSGVYDIGKGDYTYNHRLTPGICTKSDAIRVASKAGFPDEALSDAQEVLNLRDD